MVNIHEAKTHLSKLLEQVSQGEHIVIAKAGKPLAKLVPFSEESNERSIKRLGALEGYATIPQDFDDLSRDEIITLFYGEDKS